MMQLEFPLRASGKFHVEFISREVAVPFIKQWHYMKSVPSGQNFFIGGYIGSELFVVASYGKGAEMKNSGVELLAKVTGLPVMADNCLSLKRLCRTGTREDKGPVPLTKFLSICHRLLKEHHGIRFIVAFSDPLHNPFHDKVGRKGKAEYVTGGIYKAANFQYLGKTSAVYHCVDDKGNQVHRRKAYKLKERRNEKKYGPKKDLASKGYKIDPKTNWPEGAMSIAEARAELGLTTTWTPPKDRWFIDLGATKNRHSTLA